MKPAIAVSPPSRNSQYENAFNRGNATSGAPIDLELMLGEAPAKGYASHGESWSFALALRLASYRLLRNESGGEPVLLLDDVFAELDSRRRARLAEVATKAEQVLVTAAVDEDVPVEFAGVRYAVSNGEVTRA